MNLTKAQGKWCESMSDHLLELMVAIVGVMVQVDRIISSGADSHGTSTSSLTSTITWTPFGHS